MTIACDKPRPKVRQSNRTTPQLGWEPPAYIPNDLAGMQRVLREALSGIYGELLGLTGKGAVVPLVDDVIDALSGQTIQGTANGQTIILPQPTGNGAVDSVRVIIDAMVDPVTVVYPDGTTSTIATEGVHDFAAAGGSDYETHAGDVAAGSVGFLVDAADPSVPAARVAADTTSIDVVLTVPLAVSWERAALTGAIVAAKNSNATLFGGILDNGAAENDRTNLNALSTTSIIAAIADDAGNDELELTWQRAALTGLIDAAQNSNATTSAEPFVTYTASANMSAERVTTSSTTVTVSTSVASQIEFQRAALTGAIAAAANSNATVFAGIRDNGAAENDRTNLNFLSGTGITASVTDDAGGDELEVRYQWDGTTNLVPDGDKGHIVVSGTGATWLWDTTVAVTGAQAITTTGNLTEQATGDLLLNGASGTALESVAAPQTSVGTGDIVINADGGIALRSVSTAVNAVTNGNIDIACTNDLLATTGGINLAAGHTVTAADTNDIALNAAGGMALRASATPATGAATGIVAIHGDDNVDVTAGDDVTINPTDDLVIQTNGTTRARINAAGDWDFENGLDFDITGSATIDSSVSITITHAGTLTTVGALNFTGGSWSANMTDATLLSGAGFSVVATAEASVSGSEVHFNGTSGVFLDENAAEFLVGYAAPNVITSNATATNATTDLTCTSYTVPANTANVGTLYRLTGYFVYSHTAAATPTLTAELLIAGSVVESVVFTPAATADGYGGTIEALVTFRTIGSGGTAMCSMQFRVAGANTAVADANRGSITTSTDAVNTTLNRGLELRIRMTTAVASNTLTVIQGYTERLA